MNNLNIKEEPYILHVYPQSQIKNFKHSGGSKGIKIFSDFLINSRLNYDDCIIERKSDLLLLSKLRAINLNTYSHILVHYPMFPLSVLYLRIFYPKLKIVTRSHNAEFPHWLQHSYLEFKNFKFKESLKFFFTAIRNGFGELIMALFAMHILAITEWETNSYWKKLAFSKTLYTPYYLSDVTKVQNYKIKENQCVCLMSPNYSSFLHDAAKNFYKLVSSAHSSLDWNFVITGEDLNLDNVSDVPIKKLGFVDDISSLYIKSKSIAVLTKYGYGFKTKILEAAAYGCWSLVPSKNYSRIPNNVKPFCISVDLDSPMSFIEALKLSETNIPDFCLQNDELKSQFYESLKTSLLK